MRKKKLEDMSPAERRVAVAKDVLKHLNFFKVKDGNTYCFLDKLPKSIPNKGSMQDYMDKITNTKRCEVCALGAMMLSHVRLFDKFDLDRMVKITDLPDAVRYLHLTYWDAITALRENGFSLKDLDAIERAFESRRCPNKNGIEINLNLPVNPAARLGKIMQNIVKNGGDFRPEQLTKKRVTCRT